MARIAQETIQRVLDEIDIVDVISQYVDLKKRGKNYFGRMILVLAREGMQSIFLLSMNVLVLLKLYVLLLRNIILKL